MSTVEEHIEKALIRYLKAVHKITANHAYLNDTNSALNDGCDTCGHGSTGISFDIRYSRTGVKYYETLEVAGDPLNFFPTLMKYVLAE